MAVPENACMRQHVVTRTTQIIGNTWYVERANEQTSEWANKQTNVIVISSVIALLTANFWKAIYIYIYIYIYRSQGLGCPGSLEVLCILLFPVVWLQPSGGFTRPSHAGGGQALASTSIVLACPHVLLITHGPTSCLARV